MEKNFAGCRSQSRDSSVGRAPDCRSGNSWLNPGSWHILQTEKVAVPQSYLVLGPGEELRKEVLRMASGIYAGAGRQKNLHSCSHPSSALSEASVVHLACCARYCVRGSPGVDLFPVFSPPFTCLASKSQWPNGHGFACDRIAMSHSNDSSCR